MSVIGHSAFISMMYRPASCSLNVSAVSTHAWLAGYTAPYFIISFCEQRSLDMTSVSDKTFEAVREISGITGQRFGS